jgi:hypothetical protein
VQLPFSNDVNRLFQVMNELVPLALYPPGVLPIPAERIAGTAFFPGGSGLWLENRDSATLSFPVGGVMVLAHNFDSEEGFRKSVLRGKEKLTTGTWGRLIGLVTAAGIPVGQCFFTNAFMGLCGGDNSFDYRGRNDQPFRAACIDFLRTQIETQRPRLILTLGRFVPPLVSEAAMDCDLWKSSPLARSDVDAIPIVRNVPFQLGNGSSHRSNIVPLAHPSMPNNIRRRPTGFAAGREGEIEIIRAAFLDAQTPA